MRERRASPRTRRSSCWQGGLCSETEAGGTAQHIRMPLMQASPPTIHRLLIHSVRTVSAAPSSVRSRTARRSATMAARGAGTEELVQDHPFSRIVSVIIGSANSNSSAGVYIFFRALLVSSASATMFGLGAGAFAPRCIGPALSSMIGLGTGFILGLVHRWRCDSLAARIALDKYPELMSFHIQQLLTESNRRSFDEMPEGFAKMGMAITALYTASEAMNTLDKHKEQVLVDKYMAETAAQAAE